LLRTCVALASNPGHNIHFHRAFQAFLKYSMRMVEIYFSLGHDHFLSHHFKFTVH